MDDAAYQGSPGAFSEDAARILAGPEARLLPCETLEGTFQAVARGEARQAVVPVENTLAGSIATTYDLLIDHGLTITGETVLHIDHALIAPPGVGFGQVRRVLSHPIALAQCERFFREHPGIEPVSVFDTAGAVAMIVAGARRDAAAIASRRAADLHGGVVLRAGIQDHPENYTRFLCLAPARLNPPPEPAAAPATTDPPRPRAQKTTLALKVQNVPGALVRVLTPFADRGLDLSKIESRPIRGAPFEYLFYLDVVAPADAEPMQDALIEVRKAATWLRVLGSYARL